MAKIEDLLHRRTDLSTFLVHLTRDGRTSTARENLLSIAQQKCIQARTALGPGRAYEDQLADTPATQKVVCFTETPLEHTWMLVQQIEGRSVQFAPYGLALTKAAARKSHCNPVWYSDISSRGGPDWPATAIKELIKAAVARATRPNGSIDHGLLSLEPIFKVAPFFEQMGPKNDGRHKEFWWEREWRHIGHYRISSATKVVALFAPVEDHEAFYEELKTRNRRWADRAILDPRWGLERMIAALARIPDEHVGPFPAT